MRSRTVALLTLAGALALPAAAEAACPTTSKFKGSLRAAEFTGGGALGKVESSVGEPVEGRRVQVGETYYVPKGRTTKFRIHGYKAVAYGGTFLIVQCDIWTDEDLYFRLLDGKVKVSGKRIPAGAQGPPRGSSIATADATVLPLSGRPSYTATRVATSKARTTHTSVRAARGASNLFVKVSALAERGRQVPCQAGGSVTIFGNGRHRTG